MFSHVINVYKQGLIKATGYYNLPRGAIAALNQCDKSVRTIIKGEPDQIMKETKDLNSYFNYWKAIRDEDETILLLLEVRKKKRDPDEVKMYEFDLYLRSIETQIWADSYINQSLIDHPVYIQYFDLTHSTKKR